MAIGQQQPDGSVIVVEPDFVEQPSALPCEQPQVPAPSNTSTEQVQ